MTDRSSSVRDAELAVYAGSPELGEALAACDFAVVMFAREALGSLIVLANQAAADLVGMPMRELIGRDLGDFLSPRDEFEVASAALLDSGAVEGVRAERRIIRFGAEPVLITAWAHRVEVDGRRGVVGLFVPKDEAAHLGRDPAAPWRYLAAVAVGTADANFVIEQVSADIVNILGGAASEWSGVSLSGLVHPDDARRFLGPAAPGDGLRSVHDVRFRHLDGSWTTACALVAPDPRDRDGVVLFALIGPPGSSPSRPQDRATELELRLRRIGLEVRAAGLLDSLESLPTAAEMPQLAQLSTRQWEILSRLRRGDRVATIAADVYISPSTVRNHLSSIFRKFGVHSQAELIELLRDHPTPTTGGGQAGFGPPDT